HLLHVTHPPPPSSPPSPYTTLSRSQPPDRQGSPHSAGPHHSLQAGKRSTEHRIIESLEPRDDPGLLAPPQIWQPRPKFQDRLWLDRKSTRLNSSHEWISYAVFCLKK